MVNTNNKKIANRVNSPYTNETIGETILSLFNKESPTILSSCTLFLDNFSKWSLIELEELFFLNERISVWNWRPLAQIGLPGTLKKHTVIGGLQFYSV